MHTLTFGRTGWLVSEIGFGGWGIGGGDWGGADDAESMAELAAIRHDQAQLVRTARERISALESALASDRENAADFVDSGWDSALLRDGARKPTE